MLTDISTSFQAMADATINSNIQNSVQQEQRLNPIELQ
jgi:hypothetical protein